MKANEKQVQDLLYFGRNADANAEQGRFIRLATEQFPGSLFQDAYDDTKGERTKIVLPIGVNEVEYLAWILVDGFQEQSISMQVLLLSTGEQSESMYRLVMDKAKEKYPEAFAH